MRAAERVSVVVVMPVGPSADLTHVADTIDSVHRYIKNSHSIILLDDTRTENGGLADRFDGVISIASDPLVTGTYAALHLNLARCFKHASEHFEFDVLLRLDTDALVIGESPEIRAIERFREAPELGMIGSHRISSDGQPRDFSWVRTRLERDMGFLRLIRHPIRRFAGWRFLKRAVRASEANGYERGEHCLGGAYFLSRRCVDLLVGSGLMDEHPIEWLSLGDEHILALLVYASGLRVGDFGDGPGPLALKHRGLPRSPEELLQTGAKIIHSTRFFESLDESEIRSFFRRARNETA